MEKTQNVSESLNNVFRSLGPKKDFVSSNTLELCAFDAIPCFNQGLITKCQVLENLKIKPGLNMVSTMEAFDTDRI